VSGCIILTITQLRCAACLELPGKVKIRKSELSPAELEVDRLLLRLQSASVPAPIDHQKQDSVKRDREVPADNANESHGDARLRATSHLLKKTTGGKVELKLTSSRREQLLGCNPEVSSTTKFMLMPIVPMYHGSTALESVFMSSSSLTTLCSAGTWQCEARLDFDGKQACIRKDLLSRMSKYWNMSKPVLFEKGPRGLHEKVVREYEALVKEHQVSPAKMAELGMEELNLAYVVMWRPVCMSKLSKHARQEIMVNPKKYALDELIWLEDLVKSHKFLTERAVPVLVTNLADMMWKVPESKARMQSFLPCLGELDFDYVPVLNKDIYASNEWKADGSIQAYGESLDPLQCCQYNLEESSCTGPGALFSLLDGEDMTRAMDALSYLKYYSDVSPTTGALPGYAYVAPPPRAPTAPTYESYADTYGVTDAGMTSAAAPSMMYGQREEGAKLSNLR